MESTPFRDVVEELEAGDHVALFYRNRAEQLAIVIPYIVIGLARNERCLYIADESSVAMILAELEKAGVNTRAAHASGALSVVTKRETYLRHGIFEPDKMIQDLASEVSASLASGYAAFRATGEMTWALSLPSALARLSEYELKLHAEFPAKFLGLCQYNETAFTEPVLADMNRIHPIVVSQGRLLRNPLYEFAT